MPHLSGVGLRKGTVKTPLQLYREYQKLVKEFMEIMGAKRTYASVDDATEYFFYIDRNDVHFDDRKRFIPNSGEESEYCSEIIGDEVIRKDDLVMVLVASDFGDSDYYMLFDANKEIKDE